MKSVHLLAIMQIYNVYSSNLKRSSVLAVTFFNLPNSSCFHRFESELNEEIYGAPLMSENLSNGPAYLSGKRIRDLGRGGGGFL